MAFKQINKPSLPLPSWANDENLTDPGKPWDATPSKVLPGSGKRDAGFLPEENPPAQHLNQQFNELGRWIQYFANMQVLNWQKTVTINATALNTCQTIAYDEGSLLLYVAGRANVIHVSKAFEASTLLAASPVPATWETCDTKPPYQAPAHVGPNLLFGSFTNDQVVELLAGGYTAFTLPGNPLRAPKHVLWSEETQKWILCGYENTGAAPSFWWSATPIVVFTQDTPALVNSTTAEMVASATNHPSGSPLLVAIGDGALPAADVWTSTDGQTWTQHAPTGLPVGATMRSIIWDPARSLFVLTTDDSVFIATDGINWSVVSFTAYPTFPFRCLATDGDGLLVTLSESGPFAARYSTDGGRTWRQVFLPNSDAATGVGTSIIYNRAIGRFIATFTDPPNQGAIAYSFSLGDSLYDPNGDFSLPEVT